MSMTESSDDSVSRLDIFAEAPAGQVFVCWACGKFSKTRAPSKASSPGWDGSCMSNAVLCFEEKSPDGHWLAVT